ncbi:MAG: 5'/3'-nucleotidase SurE [Spirochaetaceae bacterium]|jgi:5'-nucleotidase|nr:5'/3'-nucleotidase SurE [Spirochaetaceae bacterium]
MRILATNDDGYTSMGIKILVKKLREAGHTVTILAPDRERSCSSHAMTSIISPISIQQIDEGTWSCTGTPADCALVGLSKDFGFLPELVVSGINSGSNLGIDVHYSGTVAAARQAALHRVPAIAFSLCAFRAPFYFENAAQWAAARLDELAALWSENIFINVNFPNKEALPASYELCCLSGQRYKDAIIMRKENGKSRYNCEFAFNGFTDEIYEKSDRYAIVTGKIAVTPVLLEQFSTVEAKPVPKLFQEGAD